MTEISMLRLATILEMITFHEVAGTGLSTCDPQEAKRAADRGFQVVQSVVEALPLSQILKDALPPQIDLLKIDVEGFEFKVVVGNNWQRFRPGVIMTEATFPETSVRRPRTRITPFLEGQGYHRIYFDGLNDYYAERDLGMPNNVFDRPVNVFDNFIPHAHVLLLQARDFFGARRPRHLPPKARTIPTPKSRFSRLPMPCFSSRLISWTDSSAC